MTKPTEALIYEEFEAELPHWSAVDALNVLKKMIKTKKIRITRYKLNRKAG